METKTIGGNQTLSTIKRPVALGITAVVLATGLLPATVAHAANLQGASGSQLRVNAAGAAIASPYNSTSTSSVVVHGVTFRSVVSITERQDDAMRQAYSSSLGKSAAGYWNCWSMGVQDSLYEWGFQLAWRYKLFVNWCGNGSSVLNPHTTFGVWTNWGYTFDGNIQSPEYWQIAGNAYQAEAEGHFKACITWLCTDWYPTLNAQFWANGGFYGWVS